MSKFFLENNEFNKSVKKEGFFPSLKGPLLMLIADRSEKCLEEALNLLQSLFNTSVYNSVDVLEEISTLFSDHV